MDVINSETVKNLDLKDDNKDIVSLSDKPQSRSSISIGGAGIVTDDINRSNQLNNSNQNMNAYTGNNNIETVKRTKN